MNNQEFVSEICKYYKESRELKIPDNPYEIWRGVNHVENVLHKSNDKRSAAALKSLANSSPEGRKAVDNAIDLIKSTQDAGAGSEQRMDDIRKKFRR